MGDSNYNTRGMGGRYHMPPADPGEEWKSVAEQIWGIGHQRLAVPPEKLMRGFWLNFKTDGKGPGSTDDILGTATPDDLPVINTLAKAFAVSDMWFCSAPTQTNPNRAFSLGGTSQGRQNNESFNGVPYDTLKTIFTILGTTPDNSWKIYAKYEWMNDKYFTQYMFPKGMETGTFGDIDAFESDVENDALPTYSYIEPIFATESKSEFWGNDYHPPGSLHEGETFLAKIYTALRKKPEVFNKTLLIVTFDEHGGTFDHVPPPPAIDPDREKPPFIFDHFGPRVPTLLITPCIPASSVVRSGYYPGCAQPEPVPFDHTSVLATIMRWRGIPYRRPDSKGWLGHRTAIAPTFDHIIGPPDNKFWPTVEPGNRQVVESSTLPDSAISPMVTRITDFRPGTREHDALVARVMAGQTDEERAERLMEIRAEHGDRLREAVRSS
jgi:phospholipase C